MAPYGLITAAVSLVGRSFSVFSHSGAPFRCTSIFSSVNINPVKCLTSQTSGPPKRPLNGYMRYVQQQKPVVMRQSPELKLVDMIRKLAQQWRTLSPEQKKPFEDASVRAREQFKVDLQRYRSLLTPAQLQLQVVERKQMLAKRKAIRKKRELNSLGKPKRPRSAFNIFMSEHFEEARGASTPAKMSSLLEDWKNLLGHQKKVYIQLAEDDKVRYKNEMKSWEDHMVEIGREDLVRGLTLSSKKISRVRASGAKKPTKKAKPKPATKTAAAKKSTTSSKTTKRSSTKTVVKGSSSRKTT